MVVDWTTKFSKNHFHADMPPLELFFGMRNEEQDRTHLHTFYNAKFTHQRTRKDLIDWIFEIGDKLRQSNLTIHQAVAYFDMTLVKFEWSGDKEVDKKKLEL